MTQISEKGVNCDYGVLVHQTYFIIEEKLTKQALSKKLNAVQYK